VKVKKAIGAGRAERKRRVWDEQAKRVEHDDHDRRAQANLSAESN
jgi:hypothetical protein